MKKIYLFAVMLFLPLSAIAQELSFKSLRKARVVKFTNCNMFGSQDTVKVLRGKILKFKTKRVKKYFKLPREYKYGACGKVSESAQFDSFFTKTSVDAQPEQHDVTGDNLVSIKGTIGRQCRKIIGNFPSGMVYKTPGVKYGGAASVIFRSSVSGIPFPECIQIVDITGKAIAKLGRYHPTGGYPARYYAGHGCGAKTPLDGKEIGAKAKSATDTDDILIDFGSVCVGAIDADTCINSFAC